MGKKRSFFKIERFDKLMSRKIFATCINCGITAIECRDSNIDLYSKTSNGKTKYYCGDCHKVLYGGISYHVQSNNIRP